MIYNEPGPDELRGLPPLLLDDVEFPAGQHALEYLRVPPIASAKTSIEMWMEICVVQPDGVEICVCESLVVQRTCIHIDVQLRCATAPPWSIGHWHSVHLKMLYS